MVYYIYIYRILSIYTAINLVSITILFKYIYNIYIYIYIYIYSYYTETMVYHPIPPIVIGVIFMVEMRVLIFFYVVFIILHIICAYLHIIFIYLMFGMHKPRRLLIINPMLIFVPYGTYNLYRFGYQFISIFLHYFCLFIYFLFT